MKTTDQKIATLEQTVEDLQKEVENLKREMESMKAIYNGHAHNTEGEGWQGLGNYTSGPDDKMH